MPGVELLHGHLVLARRQGRHLVRARGDVGLGLVHARVPGAVLRDVDDQQPAAVRPGHLLPGPGDGAERPQQFLDDDRRQPLGRLVEQQNLGIEGQRAADRQHLLLAAGELVAHVGGALGEARKHHVDGGERPGIGAVETIGGGRRRTCLAESSTSCATVLARSPATR